MKLSARKRKFLRMALLEAMDSTEALIQAHQKQVLLRNGKLVYRTPSEHRVQVRKWRSWIAIWRGLESELREDISTHA